MGIDVPILLVRYRGKRQTDWALLVIEVRIFLVKKQSVFIKILVTFVKNLYQSTQSNELAPQKPACIF